MKAFGAGSVRKKARMTERKKEFNKYLAVYT